MKKSALVFTLTIAVLMIVVAGCGEKKDAAPSTTQAQAPAKAANPNMMRGTVLETMNSGGYTYARVDVDGTEVWAAGPVTPLKEGAEIALVGAMGMQNFHSSTLDRTFEEILFVGEFRSPSEMPAPQAAAPQGAAPQRAAPQSSGTFAGNSGLFTAPRR